MENKYIVTVVSTVVAIIILASVLMPVIDMASGGETTIHITNEDSSTLTLQKATSGFALDLSVTTDDGDLVIANGSDTMTVDPNESFFIVATDSAAIYHDQGDTICTWTANGETQTRELTAPFTVVIADNKLTVDDGTSTDLPLPSSYMFSPSSTGGYGSFTAADLNFVPDDPVIAAGSFAGVYCYNQYSTIGNVLQEYVTVSDDVLTEVIWAAAADAADQQSIEPFDPSQIDFDPIDFEPLDPGAMIMSVPTPTYTDGDWGYDLSDGKATIVSYSGVGGGDITVPSTVGGYPVVALGKGGWGQTVFDTSLTANSLIISEGIETIKSYAMKESGFTGTLVLPESLTFIGESFEFSHGFTGTLVLPGSLTTISKNAFYECTGFTGTLVLPESVTTIGDGAFYKTTGLTGLVVATNAIPPTNLTFQLSGIDYVLDLSQNEWTTTSYGLSAEEVRTEIDAQLFLAPSDVAVTVGSPSAFAPLLNLIPVIIIMAILMMIVGYTMIHKSY